MNQKNTSPSKSNQKKSSDKRRILIAGGGGFVGSHLCRRYLDEGFEVICVDNFSTGRRKNIEPLLKNPAFRLVEADICQPLPAAATKAPLDIVANLASPASPPQYFRLAMETLAVGSEGTLRTLELARDHKARYFFASTSEVYGDPDIHPQPESYRGSVNSYGPRSMYDEAKRYAEALIYSYRRKYKVNTTIARFFNTYGPNMDPADGRVVSNFIVQALCGEPLTLYGDGLQTRSFCFVDDLVEGIFRLIASDAEGPVNLGNPGEFTVRELAEIVIELTGSELPMTKKPMPADDPLQRQPDITRAKELLGWEPKIPLREGLHKTIAYFERELV